VAVLASLVLAFPAGAAAPTPYKTNLVRNAGAEAGPASPDGFSQVFAPRWDFGPWFTVVQYGESPYFPSKAESNRFGGGDQFFSAGSSTGDPECDTANQNIYLKRRGGAIDAGRVKVIVSARVAAKGGAIARVQLYFEDGQNHSIGAPVFTVANVTGTGKRFVLRTKSRIVPDGARQFDLHLTGIQAPGASSCDAWFDRISVRIKQV
jgi:hypothetical protein